MAPIPHLSRRTVALAAGGLLGAGAGAHAADAPRRPNIVYIVADDMGYADASCYGSRDIRTPHIDSLATDGVRFTQFYANSAVCSASRLAIITGRYQYRERLGLEEPLASTLDIGLAPGLPTLPSLLRQQGYTTALVGKWHLGLLPRFGPRKSGYDHFFGLMSGSVDYFSHRDARGQPDLWEDETPAKRHGYATTLLGDRAVAVVESLSKKKRPFLLSLHFTAPHWPWEGPDDQAESERIASARDPFHTDGGTQATYVKMVEAMDQQIGRVLAALEAQGQADNTIVLFTSDNGGERFSDSWPFSGKKEELLEGGLRVPMLARWKSRVAPGQVCDQVAIHMDWFPTLLAAAGTRPHPRYPTDGMDLTAALGGAPPVNRKLYWRYKTNHQRAMRDGDFKLLKILGNSFLFNVVDDPHERANLKNRRRDVYERMKREWDAWNAGMLPQVPESFGHAFTGGQLADHVGAAKGLLTVDDVGNWPD